MTEPVRVYAGDCTTTYRAETQRSEMPRASKPSDEAVSSDPRRQRGRVVVVHKPDGTVLVHDAEGYQPVAWLTRADAVHRETDGEGGFALVAVKDDSRLRVESHGGADRERHGATPAGPETGTCPDCDGTLVRARGAVTCLDCSAEYGLPRDATTLDSTCECGLPRMTVERGARFELCVDRECEQLDEAVRERFDREWSCPECGGDLRVLRERTLFLGCGNYPECEATFALPERKVVGSCECGLPRVRGDDSDDSARADDSRCLDPDCTETPETV
ncbi:endonuclease NucS [Halorussus limi]|uniref:Endonuclease NucS n=1 Tax=Halorussus limi TaxID=2938695 RepID=A0A8U0HXW2_9EURY|nr:topoisomerase DNA-binding C4 zinc finger domain-containing protein [Halorussus limi]UPV75747.1 endonuclease NucS [Halorussus limi]